LSGLHSQLVNFFEQVASIDLGEEVPTSDLVYSGELSILYQDYTLNGLALWMSWDLGIHAIYPCFLAKKIL
jgi:hypothetical protein